MNLNKKSINKDMMPDSNTRASVATTNIFKSFLKLSLFNFKGLFKSFWIPLLLIIAPIGIGIGLSVAPYASPSNAAAVAISYLVIQGTLVIFPIILIYERSNNTFLRFKLSGYNSWFVLAAITVSFFIVIFLGGILTIVSVILVSNNVGDFNGGTIIIAGGGNVPIYPGSRFTEGNGGYVFIQNKLTAVQGILMLLELIPISIMFFAVGWWLGSKIKNPKLTIIIQIPSYFLVALTGLFFLFPNQLASQPGIVTAMALNPFGAMTNIFAFAGGDPWTQFAPFFESVPATGSDPAMYVANPNLAGFHFGGLTYTDNQNTFQSIVQLIGWLEIIVMSSVLGFLGVKYFSFYKF